MNPNSARNAIRKFRGQSSMEDTGGAMEGFFNLFLEQKIKELETRIKPELEGFVEKNVEALLAAKLKGEVGERGEVGPRGPMGPAGPKGEKGDRGDVGPMGPQGPAGTNGKDGKDGKDGVNGMDGASVILDDVMAMIQPEIQQFIRETKKEIAKMARQSAKGGAGGGGGMGNPTTFSFDGDDSTTSFNLDAKVAANGLAIWAYVNGQWIQPGVHFNVSGTTLTTTFTPATGDKLEGFFIRA